MITDILISDFSSKAELEPFTNSEQLIDYYSEIS